MVSLKVFELTDIDKKTFIDIFKEYDVEVDTIPKLGAVLRASVSNFNILKPDLISFEYQHDFKQPYELRGEWFDYPRSFKVDLWVYFKTDKHYIFVSGDKDAITFIIPELKKIIADKKFNDISIEKVIISSKSLVAISSEDGVTINDSWFNRLDENLKCVYLSGHLNDEDDNIHELYKQVKEKAGDITSINFTSRKLGYSIAISRKRGSIHTKSRYGTAETIINYFIEVIEKKL